MGAASDQNQSLGCSHRERQFAHFSRTRHFRDHRDKPDIGRDLGGFLNLDEFRIGPRRSMANRLRRFAIVILHVGGQRVTAWIEHARETGAENAVDLVGRVHGYPGSELKQVVESARMIAMSMRDRGEIKCAQVNLECLSVLGKRSRAIPRIEQNALPAEFDERRKAPFLPQFGALAEGVMKDAYAIARHGPGLTWIG